MTDASSLQILQGAKSYNSKIIELSLYVSSFTNVEIVYSTGKSLYFSDSLTRCYKQKLLEKGSDLSKEFSQLLQPPIDKKHIGTKLTNRQLTDYILSTPSSEIIDVFSKRERYTPDLQRYGTIDVYTEKTYLEDFCGVEGTDLNTLTSKIQH